jgi:hypothetical protein
MIKRYAVRCAVALAMLASAVCARAVPTLLVDSNGILTGANHLVANGHYYDVTFSEGTCDSLFQGCSVFQFTNRQESTEAAHVLLNEVLLDRPQGMFASKPNLVFGCSDTTLCAILIPDVLYSPTYVDGAGAFDAYNHPLFTRDVGAFGAPSDYDTTEDPTATYAIFRFSTLQADVPEPTSIALVSIAMLGLTFSRRKNQPKK